MAMYLGSKKVAVTNTIEKQVPSMKAFFEAGGKCAYSTATSFEGCWQYDDTANVTDMESMFYECAELLTLPKKMNLSNATNTSFMFQSCYKLTEIPQFNTLKVTKVQGMFRDCRKIKSVPQIYTSNVTNMNQLFITCENLLNVPLMDTSKVNDMSFMFRNCNNLKVIPQFNTVNVTDMRYMFDYCSSLESIHMININANLDIHYSTKFTREALLEIIGNLKAQTRGTKTLTIGSTNLAKLTDEDKAIATNKGWTLA